MSQREGWVGARSCQHGEPMTFLTTGRGPSALDPGCECLHMRHDEDEKSHSILPPCPPFRGTIDACSPAIGTAALALSCAPTPRAPTRRRTGRTRRRASLPASHRQGKATRGIALSACFAKGRGNLPLGFFGPKTRGGISAIREPPRQVASLWPIVLWQAAQHGTLAIACSYD